MKQFAAFIRKEFYHIFRDPRTMAIMLLMPIIQLILFGYAITTEIRQAPVIIFDQSRDELSTKVTDRLLASEYFVLAESVDRYSDIDRLFRQGKSRLAVIFPPQFAGSADASIQLLADATDPNEATQLTSYAQAIIASGLSEGRAVFANPPNGSPQSSGITPEVRLLYNPMMKGAYNFVPGVMGLILILICAIMTSVGIVREKETGTMEILLVSPLKPVYIILAKAMPYLLLSMVNIVSILLLSYYLLELPMAGSVLLLLSVSALYALVALSLGLLISTVVNTQQAAMLISAALLMLPVILLSGMVFPVENMPAVLRWLSNIVPAKWYIIVVKDVMIKGLPAASVIKEIGILSGMAVFLIAVSVKRFNIRLN